MIPEDRLYTEEHEWIEREEEECVIGITHFAQDELGDVVFVELPQVGDSVEAGAEMGTIESVKAVAELYSPVSGEVVAVNESVADTPELLNEDPYGEAWLVRIKWRDETELEGLLTAEQYREHIG